MHSHLAKMLGTYIIEERKKQKLNQKQLAEKLGVTPQFLGRAEKGEVMIPEWSLHKCIRILKLERKKILEIYRLASEVQAHLVYRTAMKSREPSTKKKYRI